MSLPLQFSLGVAVAAAILTIVISKAPAPDLVPEYPNPRLQAVQDTVEHLMDRLETPDAGDLPPATSKKAEETDE